MPAGDRTGSRGIGRDWRHWDHATGMPGSGRCGKPGSTRTAWRTARLCIARMLAAILILAAGARVALAGADEAVVRLVYFTSAECPHCGAVLDEILTLLLDEYGDQLEIKLVDIYDPDHPLLINSANYEMLIQAETMYDVPLEEQGLPLLIVGGEVLVGEVAIREQLPELVSSYLESGGTVWPDIAGLEQVSTGLNEGSPSDGLLVWQEGAPACRPEDEACEAPEPVWMVYFYEVGCQECSRAEYDIRYVKSSHPQLMVEEYNIQDDAALAEWLAVRVGVEQSRRLATPALFVGDDYLIGEDITSEALSALVVKYEATGAERSWAGFDAAEAEQSIIRRFESFGVVAVAFAGLVDGLNPCAFATLAFFVSYLTLSGRQGKEILVVGGAFTLGVFLAYLAVGLGFYRVLDLLGDLLTTLGRWVYGLTGVFCGVLAVYSFFDFHKARQGEIGSMALNLPHSLRMRINAVIRRGRKSRTFVAGSFVTGVVVSFLELACTGQVYLPTIIFVVSQPQLQVRAVAYLILYNLLFILPLVIVFIMAYYGTGSKQLTKFLEQRAATVKLGLTLLFATLAVWLLVSAVSGGGAA